MLNIENIDQKYYKVVNSKEWKEFQDKFNNCNNIFVLGHGIGCNMRLTYRTDLFFCLAADGYLDTSS